MVVRWIPCNPRRPYTVALCLLLSACSPRESANAEASSPAEPELAAATKTTPAASAGPVDPATVGPATVDPAKVDTAKAARHQQAARRHSKGGRWQEAIAEFKQASAANPSDGRLLCELGWTHFRGSDRGEAAATLSRGIALLEAAMAGDDTLRKPLGACFYNLGRVAEASESADAQARAAEHYRRSLELRPGNSVVERRLAALTGGAQDEPAPTPTQAPTSMACADGVGAKIDLAAWSASLRAHQGLPESFGPELKKLGLSGVTDESFINFFDEEQTPAQLRAEVTLSTLRLGEREASVVHVSLHDEEEGRAERVAVLLTRPSGELCLAGEILTGSSACEANCLSDGPPLSISPVMLIAADVEALQVDVSSGACCGIERGGVIETSFYGIEGDKLVKYAEFTTMQTWYNSPHVPVKDTGATIELVGDFPKQIEVKTDTSCTFDCEEAALKAMRRRLAAASSDTARAAITSEIDEACGPEAAECEESSSRERYVYRDGAYHPQK